MNITLSEIDDDQLRHDFPITKRTIYMNNGAIAPTPLSTIKAMTNFMLTCAEVGPDAHATFDSIISLLDELRTRIAYLINCERDEVVLVQSTTEGLNIVAKGLDWKTGDTIVVRGGRHEHFANYLPWVALSQRKGVQLRELAITNEDGFFDLGELEKLVNGSRLITTEPRALQHWSHNASLEEVGRISQENDRSCFALMQPRVQALSQLTSKRSGVTLCRFLVLSGYAARQV